MNKKRLLKLAAFLRTVPKSALTMWTWVEREADKPEGDTPGECGFAGCAMGWAAHARLFPDLSLTLGGNILFKKRSRGIDAAMDCFGISRDEACNLFLISSYSHREPTPRVVANRIQKLAEKS